MVWRIAYWGEKDYFLMWMMAVDKTNKQLWMYAELFTSKEKHKLRLCF